MTITWCMAPKITRAADNFLPFWNILCPFTCLIHNPKNQTLKKMKKTPGHIIILHRKCTINDSHMMYVFLRYEAWSTEFLVIFDCFLTFTLPLTNQKIKILKNWKEKKKTCLKISSLYNSLPKIIIICYTVPEIWHLGYFLPFHLPNSPKNQNEQKKKMKKNAWRYHFTQMYQKSWSYSMLFLRYGAWQMQLLLLILGYFLPF